jgi:hypothetical protein
MVLSAVFVVVELCIWGDGEMRHVSIEAVHEFNENGEKWKMFWCL